MRLGACFWLGKPVNRLKTGFRIYGSNWPEIRGNLKAMYREKVKSQTLKSIGFDPVGRVLELEFTGGGIYRYAGVPESVYFALAVADSKGRYFDYFIRDRYAFRKIG